MMGNIRNDGTKCRSEGGAVKLFRNLFNSAILLVLLQIILIGCSNKTTTVPAGALKASPTSIQFGADLAVNTESVVKKFTITNTANVPVTNISYGLLNGQDKIFLVGSDCTATLIVGAKCNVSASIRPDQKGKAYTETYQIKYKTDQGDETLSIKMSGSTLSSAGVEISNSLYLSGTDSAESSTKTFPNTTFGSVSEVATLGLTYQGAKPLVIQVQSPTNRVFRVVSDCVGLASGERCNIFTSFAPIGEGQETGIINITATEEGKTPEELPVNLAGLGTAPTPLATVVLYESGNEGGTEINLGSSDAGTLAKPSKKVVLKNKSESSSYLYRLSSTISTVSISYGTCNGKLSPNSECIFELFYGPSVAGNDTGYVSFVSGKSTAFIKVKGSATDASPAGSPTDVSTDKDKVEFPFTDIEFASEQKTVKITNNNVNLSGKITMGLEARDTPFSYTTTCVDNTPLRGKNSCEVYLTFRPSSVKQYSDNFIINIAGATNPIKIPLTGEGKAVSLSDNSTNIPNLTVSTKKYNFPDTGLGLKSASHQFTLHNSGTTDITGFTSTSTDLIRFSLDSTLTTCGSTIKADEFCTIAYRFNALGATQYRAYIKLFADGAEGGSIDEAPELIELIGRGVLFNKYIYFGVVEPGKSKDITYAVVNDTNSRRDLGETSIKTVQWIWSASEVSGSTKDTWFPNNSGEISSKFTQKEFTSGEERFFIVSDTCKNQKVDAGSSCILKIRYQPKAGDNASLSAYITFKDREGNTLDQLHATASPVDNVVYFFPPDSTDMPRILWDSQSAVIGESIYVFTGTDEEVATIAKADDKLRRYDAARNKWSVVDANGLNPVEYVNRFFADSARMISYNEKLYMYGGNAKNPVAWMNGLFMFDPSVRRDGKFGEWVRYDAGPTNINNTNIAGYDGKIYVFGGSESSKWTAKGRQLHAYDITTNKWTKLGEAPIGDVNDNVTPAFPRERGSAAILFFGNKMFLHGGHGNFALRDDLWEYTAEMRDKNGAVSNPEVANKWRVLTKQINTLGNVTTDADENSRPIARDKHNFNIIGSKLLLKGAGFNRERGNTTIVTGAPNYYFIFDPATGGLNNDDGKADLTKLPFNGWSKFDFDTSKLAQHTASVIENVLWFHNRTVMGVLFSTKFEALGKE